MTTGSVSGSASGSAQRVIAVVGLAGTGKSEVVRLITEALPFTVVYFGGVVMEEVERRGLEVNPTNERTVREDLRATHGMAAMATLSLPKINAALERGENVLIDGLYSFAEFEVLTAAGLPLATIAVHADRAVRAERLSKRPTRPLTRAEMDARDDAEIRNLDKAPPIVLADRHVLNNGDMAALKDRVLTLI